MAVFIAVCLHALLFLISRPPAVNRLAGMPMTPITRYLGGGSGELYVFESDPRMVSSPVLFSLPSKMGFSRELMEKDVTTRLTFSQPVEAEQFLRVDLLPDNAVLNSQQLMLTARLPQSPALPAEIYALPDRRVSARRVQLAPELKERLSGGIVLPVELNQEVSKAWEIRAQIHVSAEGMVEHVFLDQPLESRELTMRILQLLYGLRFSPGTPIDGIVEIYSPETMTVVEEVQP
ncbi:hypothetical protein P4E94_02955 [Pontiellaceae bacterium B12219]|nr:hypothetical protein [Pontiellaceae bacterium B12219]